MKNGKSNPPPPPSPIYAKKVAKLTFRQAKSTANSCQTSNDTDHDNTIASLLSILSAQNSTA